LLVFAFALAILIERGIYLFKCKINAHIFMKEIISFINAGKIAEAKNFCAKYDAPLSLIISAGISHSKKGKASIKDAVDEVAINEIPKLLKRTHYLPLIANVATLLGLLGTVLGLMQSFVSLGSVDPSQKAALIALGFSTAMNNTAFGLIVAIPCMLGHAYLSSTTQDIIHDIDICATKLISHITQKEANEN
jgi:biopolymer transport protein ExbB/TolQ